MPPLISATIGRIVIYRSRTGAYDVPAIVTCTAATLNPAGVEVFNASGGTRGLPPLSGLDHVHLTVLTPGLPGQRGDADDFLVQPGANLLSENVAGCYQEWDIPPAFMVGDETSDEPPPGTWRWPTRT